MTTTRAADSQISSDPSSAQFDAPAMVAPQRNAVPPTAVDTGPQPAVATAPPTPPIDETRYRHLLRRYSTYAPLYDRVFGQYTEGTLSECVRLADAHAPDAASLLDVCCGTGQLAVRLRPQHPQLTITGIDLSREMLDEARKRIPDDARTTWRHAPAEHLPFDADSFDLVTCNNAFHLIAEQERTLREFHRVVTPDGCLILLDWNPAYLTMRAMQIVYRLTPGHPRRMHTRKHLTAMIERAGFRTIESHPFRATWFWGMSAIVATPAR